MHNYIRRLRASLYKYFFCAYTKEERNSYLNKIMHGSNCCIEYPVRYIVGGKYISVGDNFYANKLLYLGAYDRYQEFYYSPSIRIGHNVHLNYSCQIVGVSSVELGDNILTGSNVLITDCTHGSTELLADSPPPLLRPLVSRGPVKIGNNVLIGNGAVIMANADIGDNCVIGANAVVSSYFPPNSVIVGVPAKKIK